ncbi:MAG: NHL repeat-containing protein [Actinomycetota bacterium]|nr:NHL repeat-containing protein [Actinomycetota bacterium]
MSRRPNAAPVCVVLLAALVTSVGTGSVATALPATVRVVSAGTVPGSVVNGKNALYAWGAATMRDGSVAIGDIWNGQVVQYAKDGTRLGVLFKLPGGGSPYGLAVDPNNGTIYVGKSSCCSVFKYVRNPATGTYSQGSSIVNNAFRYPSRVTVRDDGWVYIADMLVGQIFVYDNAGNFRSTIGTKGAGPGQLRQPRAMAFDASGRLYVVDAFNVRVSVFTASGRFLFEFGSLGAAQKQFAGSDLRGLSLDRTHGWVYVVDGTSNYIKKFDLSGNFLMNFGGTGGRATKACCAAPVGTFQDGGRESTLDGNGNLWVSDMPAFRAEVFDSSGTPLFQVPATPQFPAPGGYNDPQGVAVDSHGNVLVSDTRNFRIQKFSPSGQFLWQEGLRGRFSGYALNYARGINADPRDGSILVADNFSSVVKKFDGDGTFLWKVGGQGAAPGQLNHPSQAAVGPDGTVYVADSWNKRITVYSASGLYLRTILSSAGFTMKDPRGIAVDPSNGDLYVTDLSARAVFHLRNNGTWVSTIGSSANLGQVLGAPNQSAVDANNVYTTDSSASVVRIYNKSSRQFVGSITGVKGPCGISISSSGMLYVSEVNSAQVSKWQVS